MAAWWAGVGGRLQGGWRRARLVLWPCPEQLDLSLQLSSIDLNEQVEGDDRAFEVWHEREDSVRKYLLQARTVITKNAWVKEISSIQQRLALPVWRECLVLVAGLERGTETFSLAVWLSGTQTPAPTMQLPGKGMPPGEDGSLVPLINSASLLAELGYCAGPDSHGRASGFTQGLPAQGGTQTGLGSALLGVLLYLEWK